jgi:hypothetical protein
MYWILIAAATLYNPPAAKSPDMPPVIECPEGLTTLAESYLVRPCMAQTVMPAAHTQYPAAHGFPSSASHPAFTTYRLRIR